MWRRYPLAAEAYLGEIIGSTRSAPTVSRRAPAGSDRAARIARPRRGTIGPLAILLCVTAAIEVAAFGPLRAAPAAACALYSTSLADAIAMALALRADLVTARKEIAAPALSAEDKAVLLRRLELRIRFADSIIACRE